MVDAMASIDGWNFKLSDHVLRGNGRFVAGYVRSLELGRGTHVATKAVLMTLQHLLKVIVFGLLGFNFALWVGFMIMMIATGFLGTLVGRQVLVRMNGKSFAQVLRATLVLLALRLLWQGGAELVGR